MNAYAPSRRVGIDITFALLDTEAAGNATPTASGAEAFSDLSLLLSGEAQSPGKGMTMEDGLVVTDGTWSPLPDDAVVPWWSTALSDESGQFTAPPTLTLELSAPASSVGFSLTFDEPAGCWPSLVRITAYRGGEPLEQQTFAVSGPLLAADLPVEGYDRVVAEFLATPVGYRRVKLYSFLFGIVQRFDPDTIVTATFSAGCSAACESIPSAELVFTFDNQAKKYNLINPQGLYRYLQDGQVIETGLSIDGEWVEAGTFYFTRSEAKDGALTAQITANDRVLTWDGETWEGGTSGSWTLGEALRAVLGEEAAVSFGPDLEGRTVGKAIPNGTSKREAVRLLCQAARCTCWVDRAGVVTCRALEIAATGVDTLDGDNLYDWDGVGVSERVDSVSLTVKDEFADTEQTYTAGSGTNPKSISNPCAVEGQAVAEWLLGMYARRLSYDVKNRGNPAVLTGETITIYNAYQEAGRAAVTEQTFTYDGGLTAQTKALGEAWT